MSNDNLYRAREFWDFVIPVTGTNLTILSLKEVRSSSKFIQGSIAIVGFTGTVLTTYLSHKNYTDRINNSKKLIYINNIKY